MKSIIFTGKDEADFERKIWDWQCEGQIKIVQRHAIERLPISFRAPQNLSKVELLDQVRIRIDYE